MLNNRKLFICENFNVFKDTIDLVKSTKYYDLFGIMNDKNIKFYKDCFNYETSKSFKYFNSNIFKDVFFNNMFLHSNILKMITKYDDNLGLYSYCDYVNGNILDDYIKTRFNSNMFYNILDNMVDALIYIHSHGLLYLNFSFKNILYRNNNFILHNFEKVQVVNDKYSDNKNNILTDVFMLGSMLLSYILKINNIDIPIQNIELKYLTIYKYLVISTTNMKCFHILQLMLLPEKNRIYLNELKNIKNIKKYKLYKERKPYNISEYDEMCHSYFSQNDYLYDDIKNDNNLEFLNNNNLIYFTFIDTFSKKFNIDKKTAMFLSQILIKDDKIDLSVWAINYGIPIQFINMSSLNILLSQMKVNIHQILCNECKIIVKPLSCKQDTPSNNVDINNNIFLEQNTIKVINKSYNKNFSPKYSLLSNIINIIRN